MSDQVHVMAPFSAAGKQSWRAEKRSGFASWGPDTSTIASSRGGNKMQEQRRRTCSLIHPADL